MSMKKFVGKTMTKETNFMNEKVKIKKLSVSQVMEIQELSKNVEASEEASMKMLKFVIGCSVEDASELSDEEFRNFPIDELSKLSNDILTFSGLGNAEKK